MTLRPLGLLEDDKRHPRKAFADLRGRLRAEPAGHADLSPFAGPVLDQNRVGWCTCNTLMAAATTLTAQGTPLGFVPSQRVGYQLALRLDRADDYPLRAPQDMPALSDRGSQILTMVEVANRYGVVPMGPNVWVDGYVRASDCSPDNATDETALDLQDVIDASQHLIVGAYEIEDWHERKLEMMLALDAWHSLAVGGFVDTAYMNRTVTYEPCGACDWNDPDGGGHCQEIVAYKSVNGVRIWKVKNSWSRDWGAGGYTWVTDEFVDALWSVFAMDVELAVRLEAA